MADPASDSRPSSSGFSTFLFVLIGLALLGGAVFLGWKLGHPSAPAVTTATATPTPTVAPSGPPENPAISKEELQEVLKRIDLAPNVAAEQKERLYAYVERAHSLKRLVTVAFETGKIQLSAKEIARLEKESKLGDFANYTRDPSAVFVVLGYADKRGDEKKNLQISLDRTTSVMDVLHKRCGVKNAVQTIPMGSPQLFDPQGHEENRVAEIWGGLL